MKIEVDPNIFLTYKAKDIQTLMSSNPVCIEINEKSTAALTRLKDSNFDQAPVISNGALIGWVLKRQISHNTAISEVFSKLSHADLISADAPLNDLLQRLVNQELIFIVGTHGIEGFAVRSDIQRHVSRAHLFLLISGLEIMMTRIVAEENNNSIILDNFMSPDSLKAWESAKRRNLDANPIEYLDLRALSKVMALNQQVMNHIAISKEDWKVFIDVLKILRDGVAHSNTEKLMEIPFPLLVSHMNRMETIIRKLVRY